VNLDQFDYQLPEELIAQSPLPKRTASRLLQFNRQASKFVDMQFSDLPDVLHQDDLLVFNDTKVIPARLYGKKESGGKVEFLLERVLGEHKVLAQLRASKSPKLNSKLLFSDEIHATVVARENEFFILRFEDLAEFENLLTTQGQVPLPPYINRMPDEKDTQRYQTVYAKQNGAVAAPTAGLHFDELLLQTLQQHGVQFAYVTLHVGAGTFQPVREEIIEQHQVHAEQLIVTQQVCQAIIDCKQRGGRVIAVGTTTVRALEAAAQTGNLESYKGDTSLFIYPGYEFKVVDAMITNFHLPKSSLLMLVSAFAGYATTMAAYQHAVSQAYRFYSYGDAMFIS